MEIYPQNPIFYLFLTGARLRARSRLFQGNEIILNILAIVNRYQVEASADLGWRFRPVFIVEEQQYVFDVACR